MQLNMVLMVLLTLLRAVDVLSTGCPSSYTQVNFVLRNHALASSVVKNDKECQDKCASHMECASLNFYHKTSLCELNKASHLSNPMDLTHNIGGKYILYNKRDKASCSDKYCSTGLRCVTNKESNTYHCQVCASALGMQSKKIPNSAITASSMHSAGHEQWRARLHNYPPMPFTGEDKACWVAKVRRAKEYLQIDLGHVVYVTMVATQGRPYKLNQRVTKYSLAYKSSDNKIVDYQDGNRVKIFAGNTDRDTVVTHDLPEKIQTQLIKFVVLEWTGLIAMRAEIYGCPVE